MFSRRTHHLKRPRLHRHLSLLATYAVLPFVTLSAGATSFADILAVERGSIEEGITTQKRIDRIDDERADLVAQYRVALKQQQELTKYNKQLRAVIQSQQAEAASIEEQLLRVNNLERDIVPLMSDMLAALEDFIAMDAPFLAEERQGRVRKLRKLFAAPKVSNSEKYRRILEGYQIENDYGRTIEAYDAPLQESGKAVTFLKVGRVIFLYQTLDGAESFYWQPENRQWQSLDKRFNQPVSRAIKMAREQIPSDLLLLPVAMPRTQ